MKTHKSLSTLLVVAFALAPRLLNTSRGALAALGRHVFCQANFTGAWMVLYPGKQVGVEWTATFPDMRNLHTCEMELWLAAGRSQRASHPTRHYDWIRSEHAYQCGGSGHSLRVRIVLRRKLQPTGCIDFCNRPDCAASALNPIDRINASPKNAAEIRFRCRAVG